MSDQRNFTLSSTADQGLARTASLMEGRRPRTKEELKRCSDKELESMKTGNLYIERRKSLPSNSSRHHHGRTTGGGGGIQGNRACSSGNAETLQVMMEEAKHCRYLRCDGDGKTADSSNNQKKT